jgi:hypothetical protein
VTSPASVPTLCRFSFLLPLVQTALRGTTCEVGWLWRVTLYSVGVRDHALECHCITSHNLRLSPVFVVAAAAAAGGDHRDGSRVEGDSDGEEGGEGEGANAEADFDRQMRSELLRVSTDIAVHFLMRLGLVSGSPVTTSCCSICAPRRFYPRTGACMWYTLVLALNKNLYLFLTSNDSPSRPRTRLPVPPLLPSLLTRTMT